MIPYIYAFIFWACTPIQIFRLYYTLYSFIGAIDRGTHLPLLTRQLTGLSTCGSDIQWSCYMPLMVAQYQETFIMISSDQLAQASATNEARFKAMNCNKMSTPTYRPYRGLVCFFESWQTETTILSLECIMAPWFKSLHSIFTDYLCIHFIYWTGIISCG